MKTLAEKMKYYRSINDYRLIPNCPVILMLDGRSFSKFCKIFKKPYDDDFIKIMNEVAIELSNKIDSVKFSYVQSDEISLLLLNNNESEPWFNYRLEKICSIAASIASSKFNQLMMLYISKQKKIDNINELVKTITEYTNAVFDCKAWNVPDYDTAYLHFLWRQRDCIRNSKQMISQIYFSHKELNLVNTDKQIEMVKEKYGIDWHTLDSGKKYGRMIYKEPFIFESKKVNRIKYDLINKSSTSAFFKRYKNIIHEGFDLSIEENKAIFMNLIKYNKNDKG